MWTNKVTDEIELYRDWEISFLKFHWWSESSMASLLELFRDLILRHDVINPVVITGDTYEDAGFLWRTESESPRGDACHVPGTVA